MNILTCIGVVMSISILVDWTTQIIGNRNISIISATIVALAIYFMWWVIATGGILC